jgi:hypothetical protein
MKIKDSDSWFTPDWLVHWAHTFLGGPPDFDPASCAKANASVQASKYDYLHPEDHSVVKRWHSHWVGPWTETAPNSWPKDAKTVFMNPPFSRAKEFTRRLVNWHSEAPGSRLFFAVLPANPNSAYWQDLVRRYHVFLPEKRVAFIDGKTGEIGKAPRGNVCIVTSHASPRAPVPGIWIGT